MFISSLSPVSARAQSTDSAVADDNQVTTAAGESVRVVGELEVGTNERNKDKVPLAMLLSRMDEAMNASPRRLRHIKLYPTEIAGALQYPQEPVRDWFGNLHARRLTTRQSWAKEGTFALPMDTIPFWVASGIVEYALHDKGDPAFMANFVKKNITSAEGLASLFAFSYINRGVLRMFKAAGLTYVDPFDANVYRSTKMSVLKDIKSQAFPVAKTWVDPEGVTRTEAHGRPTLKGPSRFQKFFGGQGHGGAWSGVAGPLALAFSMLGSSLITELIADVSSNGDLTKCVKTFGRENISEQEEEACDKAFYHWNWGEKFADHRNSIINGFIIPIMQPTAQWAVVKLFKGADWTAGKLLIRGGGPGMTLSQRIGLSVSTNAPAVARFVRLGITRAGPYAQFAVSLGHIAVFIIGNELLNEKFWEAYMKYSENRYGNKITEGINFLHDRIKPLEQMKGEELRRYKKGYEECKKGRKEYDVAKIRTMDVTPEMQKRGIVHARNTEYLKTVAAFETDCKPMLDIERALFNLKEANANWRSKLLGKAAELHEQWKSFLIQYATTYSAAEQVYTQIMLDIAYQRYVSPKVFSPAALYNYDLLTGIAKPEDLVIKDEAGQKIDPAGLTGDQAREYKRIELLLKYEVGLKRISEALEMTKKAIISVKAATGAVPTFRDAALQHLAIIEKGLAAGATISLQDAAKKPNSVTNRKIELNAAILELEKVVGRFSYPHREHRTNWVALEIAKDPNLLEPFIAIWDKLNRVSSEVEGAAYLARLNENDSIIPKENSNEHPKQVGYAHTPRMVDYLLASMVCGPRTPIKISEERPSLLSRFGTFVSERTFGKVPEVTYPHIEGQFDPSIIGVSGNPNMFADGWSKMHFFPPSVTSQDLQHLCERADRAPLNPLGSPHVKNPANTGSNPGEQRFDMYMSEWDLNGKKYQGLLSVLKDQVRPDLVTPTEYDSDGDPITIPFTNWWATNVETVMKKKVLGFRRRFTEILDQYFLPVFNKKDYETYQGRPFAIGIQNSLMEELKLYLKIAEHVVDAAQLQPLNPPPGIVVTEPTNSGPNMAKFKQAAADLQMRVALNGELMADIPSARGAVFKLWKIENDKNKEVPLPTAEQLAGIKVLWDNNIYRAYELNSYSIKRDLQILGQALKTSGKVTEKRSDDTVTQRMIRRLVDNIEKVVAETDQYLGVVHTLRSVGMDKGFEDKSWNPKEKPDLSGL